MKTLTLLLALALTPLAHAQDNRGIYMGAGLGSFDYDDVADEDFEGELSDSTYAYTLFGGYKFSDHFALELALGGTGTLETSYDQFFPGFGVLTIDVDATFDIYSLTALGILPLERIDLFAGAGYFSASANLEGSVQGQAIGTDGFHDNGTVLTFGIQRDFGLDLKSLSLRAQYQFYDFSEGSEASGLLISGVFRF